MTVRRDLEHKGLIFVGFVCETVTKSQRQHIHLQSLTYTRKDWLHIIILPVLHDCADKYDSIVFSSYPPCLVINAQLTKLGETSYGTYPNLESDWQGIKAPLCANCLTISPAEALFVECFWFISAVVIPPLSLHSTDGSSHSIHSLN